jgi:hypothetical protein
MRPFTRRLRNVNVSFEFLQPQGRYQGIPLHMVSNVKMNFPVRLVHLVAGGHITDYLLKCGHYMTVSEFPLSYIPAKGKNVAH